MERDDRDESRQPALDGLRGIAILAVVISHFSSLIPRDFAPLVVRAVMSYGWAGVDLFFALSGFLITRILLRTKGYQGYLRSFWARRALRILPLYFVTLVAVLVVGDRTAALHGVLPPAADRPLYFMFLTNWASLRHGWTPNMLGHMWSLAVEEQFYLIWPFCVLFLSRRGLAVLTIAIAVGAMLFRAHYVATFGPADFISLSTLTRADGLALGALTAVLLSAEVVPARVRAAGVVAVAALAAFCAGVIAYWTHAYDFYETAGFSLLAIGFAASVYWAAATRSGGPVVRGLEMRWLRNLGKYSFGIYLLHVPLLEAFRYLVVLPNRSSWRTDFALVGLGITALWLATYYLAKLSFERFEAPIMRLKRYARTGSRLPANAALQPKGLKAATTEST